MRYALLNGEKIEAVKSGEIAECPACGCEVRAYCGDLVIWHWKHCSKKHCDPWWENETPWHRNWKKNFPKEWQEVIIEDQNEKHVADIRTKDRLVIEFQNSPMSVEVMNIREMFYKNMIWVVNAEKFKENLVLRSIVTQKVKRVENEYHDKYLKIRNILSYSVESKKKDLEKNEDNYGKKKADLKKSNDIMAEYTKYSQNLHETASIVAKKILTGSGFWSWDRKDFWDFFKAAELKYHEEIITNDSITESLNSEIKNVEDKLKYLKSFEDKSYEGKIYKIFSEIDAKKIEEFYQEYELLLVVDNSIDPLFPSKPEKIRDIFHLSKILRDIHRYDLYIDSENSISDLRKSKKELLQKIGTCERKFQNIIINISKDLEKWLHESKKSLGEKSDKINQEIEKLESEIKFKKKILKKMEGETLLKSNQVLKRIEQQKEQQKYKVMRENKGRYELDWKYERKVWIEANCKVFFDIGEDYLLQIQSRSLVKKISKDDFLTCCYKNNF